MIGLPDMTDVVSVQVFEPTGPGKGRDMRIEFTSIEAARAHRRRVGCGGWILGPYLFPGTGWTPSRVMENCPVDGLLE